MSDTKTYRMFVKSIGAKCDANEGTISRTMQLVDLESTMPNVWSTEVSLSMPAFKGLGSGDIVELTVTHVATAAEYETEMGSIVEARREQERLEARAKREDELREEEALTNEIRGLIETEIRTELEAARFEVEEGDDDGGSS